jgi:glycosyltransferase involved in cell wall biosynthesis
VEVTRLLFLSWSYPPMPHPRATQVARLASHVGSRPLEVYCLASSGDSTVRSRDPSSGIDLVRIPRVLPTRILERCLAARRHRTLQEYDVKHLWWRKAADEILRQRLSGNDVLVTFGQPMVDHLAGLEIKRKTGVRWVAHFSDPWADNPFDPTAKEWLAKESGVLEAVDLAVFTSQETVDLVFAKYPAAWRAKARVLPHAFDASLYPEIFPTGNYVTVRYLGNLFTGRGPEPLFDALAVLLDRSSNQLDRVRFEFVGEVMAGMDSHPLMSRLPSRCVSFLPKVTYLESLALMKSADLLLNIDASADISVFLPSKLVDYVGAGRPIFGITPPGTSASLVRALGGWVADPKEPSAIADQLTAALGDIEQWRDRCWGKATVRAAYEAKVVAASFEEMIRQLLHDNVIREFASNAQHLGKHGGQ